MGKDCVRVLVKKVKSTLGREREWREPSTWEGDVASELAVEEEGVFVCKGVKTI